MQQYVLTTYKHKTVTHGYNFRTKIRDMRIQSAIVCCCGDCKAAENKYTL